MKACQLRVKEHQEAGEVFMIKTVFLRLNKITMKRWDILYLPQTAGEKSILFATAGLPDGLSNC